MTATRSYRMRSAVSAVTRRIHTRAHVLAEPPAGSGLKPVYGEGGLPLVGASMDLVVDMVGVMRRQYGRFGEVSWLNAFGLRGLVVLGPDGIAEVLTNRDKAFANAGWKRLLDPFFHRGIMLLDFEEHRHDRRIMQQAFGRPQLPGGAWHRGLAGRRYLADYFCERLPAKRAGSGNDLFSVLCHARDEDGNAFTDDDIVNHMIFVLLAAHDTSTITLAMPIRLDALVEADR